MERTGQMPPLHPGSFCGDTHRPGQLREEIEAAGLDVIDLVSVEGLAFALADLEERIADPAGRQLVLDTAGAIERVPELLGLGRISRPPPGGSESGQVDDQPETRHLDGAGIPGGS